MEDPKQELSATHRWVIGLIITIIIQTAIVVSWATTIQSNGETNTARIDKLETRIDNVDSDIRAILVGIEQVKARLGIVEEDNK